MKRIVLGTVSLIFAFHAHAQKILKAERASEHSVYIKGDIFEGCIFDKSYHNRYFDNGINHKTISPNQRQILKVEKIICNDINKTNNYKIKDNFVRKNIIQYLRQYSGFKDKKGEFIIVINGLWKRNFLEAEKLSNKTTKGVPPYIGANWKSEWQYIDDGGHNYWDMKVNISTGKIVYFCIHGLA